MEAFVVYKIENILDGKSYVGRTNDIKRRLKEHIRRASSSLIHRAIQKHGFDNFSIRILFATDSLKESEEKELEFIINENTLFPNGYNLTLKPNPATYRKPKTINEKQIKKERPPTSLMDLKEGRLKEFRCSITFNKKKLRKTFPTPILAAEAYDKMSLFLKGDKAHLNFPEKLEDYLSEDLELFYQNFICSKTQSSKYLGVSWNTRTKKWKVIILKNEKTKQQKTISSFSEERAAAEAYDKIALFLRGQNAKINFEERREEFLNENLQEFYLSIASVRKTSKYKYVVFSRADKKWKFSFRRNGKNTVSKAFSTEEEAYQALVKVIESGLGPNRKQRIYEQIVVEDYKNLL